MKMRPTKLWIGIALSISLLLVVSGSVLADKPAEAGKSECTTIQDEALVYSSGHYLEGDFITTGFDAYGYNYQGHMFRGSYFNSYAGGDGFPVWEGDDITYLAENDGAADYWAWPYRDVKLSMKWNDAWISNRDCDGDGKLDRHFGFDSYIGSGAWLTNHQSGEYVVDEETGETCKWNYFVKIVAVPEGATRAGVANDGVWFGADGVEIGPDIWGEFAIIQQVENDNCAGIHGLQYISPASAGLGCYKP